MCVCGFPCGAGTLEGIWFCCGEVLFFCCVFHAVVHLRVDLFLWCFVSCCIDMLMRRCVVLVFVRVLCAVCVPRRSEQKKR